MEVEFPIEPHLGAEADADTYQVAFWEKLTAPEPPATPLWRESPHRLHNVIDVRDALRWAEENAEGRSFTVHLEAPSLQGTTLFLIAGVDPTRDLNADDIG